MSEIDLEMKIEQKGPDQLENWELIALILRRGNSKTSVFKLSKQIAELLGGCQKSPSVDDLLELSGVGIAKACQILACLELSSRFILLSKGQEVRSPEDCVSVLSHLKFATQEEFWVLCLDSQSRLIDRKCLSVGLVNQTAVHPREAFRFAIQSNAVSVVFSHNHPSGESEASKQDLMVTSRLIEVGELIGIDVVDHVIITRRGSNSLRRCSGLW